VAPTDSAASLARRLLVRGDILELLIPQFERSRSKGATFSFAHDNVDSEDTFIGDGTVGWELWGYRPQQYPTAFPYLQNAKVVPYFKYDSTGKQATDLPEYIEPGVMINAYLHKNGSFAANAGLTASRIIDDNDGSDQSSLSAYMIPSFIMFTGLPVFQNLRGYLEYRLMHNFGVRDADLFQAGLYYPLFGELLSLNFDYSDGRDLATLLEDERYMLGLAFRY